MTIIRKSKALSWPTPAQEALGLGPLPCPHSHTENPLQLPGWASLVTPIVLMPPSLSPGRCSRAFGSGTGFCPLLLLSWEDR